MVMRKQVRVLINRHTQAYRCDDELSDSGIQHTKRTYDCCLGGCAKSDDPTAGLADAPKLKALLPAGSVACAWSGFVPPVLPPQPLNVDCWLLEPKALSCP